MSFTEICEGQYNFLKSNLYQPFLGTVGTFKATRTNEGACPNNKIGTAVFSWGAPGSYVAPKNLGSYDGQETRYLVCQKVYRFAFLYTTCAGHFSNHPTNAESQIQTAFTWWITTHTMPWMVGGDFNRLFTGSTGLAQWYYTHWEIHIPFGSSIYTHYSDAQGFRKIDYVFADRGAWGAGPSSGCTFTSHSDHAYCNGHFQR